MFEEYDVIVVGAGHAGCEAAHASAKMGCSTLLVTMNMQTIAQMSCNPAMGGVAKGQIVREIDALGGWSGVITDKTMIQFRMLNRSKGPAMWSPRAQSDRNRFAEVWRLHLEQTPNLDFWQESVVGLLVEGDEIRGVKTSIGIEIRAKKVVLTNGTFLNGLIHIGLKQFGGGRIGEKGSTGITEQLVELGFSAGRMKTGTPPRLDGRSINYSIIEEQKGDDEIVGFSYRDVEKPKQQRSCHITYTNTEVHDILREGFDRSPMFNGSIEGLGPRYCPSIEDKINRFQIFVEPEGWDTVEVYINGFSTSLPEDIQFRAVRKIPGFENAKLFRPGYAIEYDYFPPTQLGYTLETKLIKGLYFAGQINGTTGYEEAACQGLVAGINAALSVQEKEPLILNRTESYIGVLIDDLITKGTEEPYRMFTSRAEHRLLLRQDNADLRLSEKGFEIGLLEESQYNLVREKVEAIKSMLDYVSKASIKPEEINDYLQEKASTPINQQVKVKGLIQRPNIALSEVMEKQADLKKKLHEVHPLVVEQVEIEIKYESYFEKEREQVQKLHDLEHKKINPDFDYTQLKALSAEAREKLRKVKPATIGQASRISGVSPADVSILIVHLQK
jgi:tRNA uridine 5-carboxymethylaminomethyl modification enzyme